MGRLHDKMASRSEARQKIFGLLIIHEVWFCIVGAGSREDGKLIAEDDAGQTRCRGRLRIHTVQAAARC